MEERRNKRGAVVALLVLAAVLVAGTLGYRALAGSVAGRNALTEAAVDADASAGESDDDALWLSDLDATVYTDLGEPVLLTQLADGKPLVINFWATWCPYCVDELPDYQQLYEQYSDRVNFAFVDVADGQRDTRAKASAWLTENGFDALPDYYDEQMEATTTYGAWSLPTTVVVSTEGEVLTITPGRIDLVLMQGALNSLV